MDKIETPEEVVTKLLCKASDYATMEVNMADVIRADRITIRADERQKAAVKWHNAKTDPPLRGREVIAWSVIMRDSLYAWVSMLDGKWYEGNFTDEPIAGVEWWTDKPEPPAIMAEPEEATR